MADLLSSIVQALRHASGQSSASASGGNTGATGATPAAADANTQRLLSSPQMLQVMAVARDQILLGIGRQQVALTPQQLPSAGAGGAQNGMRVGQQVLMQLLSLPEMKAAGQASASAGARPQLQTLLWQQVLNQLTQQGLLNATRGVSQAATPPATLQVPIQVAPSGQGAPLLLRPQGQSAAAWQLPVAQLGSQVSSQIQAAAAATGQPQTGQLQLSITPASAQHPQGPRANLQMTIGGNQINTQVPLQQLPPALLGQLLQLPVKSTPLNQPLNLAPLSASNSNSSAANTALGATERQQPALAQMLPLQRPSQALAPLQGRAQSPAQVQAFLQNLSQSPATLQPAPSASSSAMLGASSTNTPAQTTPAVALASQAVQQLAQSILGQLPQGQDFARSEQLQQWVSQWFAAKPVSLQPQQSLAGIGQLLLLALGAKLAQSTGGASGGSNAPTQFSQQLNQWLQGATATTAQNPAAAAAPNTAANPAPNFAGLPPVLLQQLLQNLGGGMNSARISQANLVETSRAGAPDYHILLPMGSSGQPKDAELLIQRRREKKKKYEQAAEDQWLFKLRMDLQQYGPVLVKGKYQASGTKIQFITENIGARVHIQHNLKLLEARLAQLKVKDVELTAIRGKVPETLREQGENIIHIQV